MTTDFTKCLKLLGKLHKILQAINYIAKDARNQFSNYNYASEKAIKLHLHAAFAEYGVMMFVSQTDAFITEVQDQVKVDQKTGTRNVETCKIAISKGTCMLVDIESGESIEFDIYGAGNGRDDKGIYASLTGIIKYALTTTFLIPTGDDAEKDGETVLEFIKQPEPIKGLAKESVPASTPPATKPANRKPAAKPQEEVPPAQPPVEQQKVEKRADFGKPDGKSPVISEAEKQKILLAFNKFNINIVELEQKAGYPISLWTADMKKNLNADYQVLKLGKCTKEQFLASECVVVDFGDDKKSASK